PPPDQTFPSRSSNSALIPRPPKSDSSENETPNAFMRKRPLVVPAHMLPSWSRKRASTSTVARAGGRLTLVNRVPSPRYNPLLVPTHNSLSPTGNKQLIFLSEIPVTRIVRPSAKKKRPAAVPSQILPSRASAIARTRDGGRTAGGAST